MRIGELARRAGVPPHTIRYYEHEGLLAEPVRTASGYRNYGDGALGDLQFIRKAQALGLSLGEIHEVMEIASGGRPPCDHVRAALEGRLADVDERMAELRALGVTLREALSRLAQAPRPRAGCRCAVIEGL